MEKKLWACCGIAFLLALANLVAEGWAQDTSCLNQLAPCLNYLNGTEDPPDSCCDPLKSVINSDPKCLCSLVSNKGSSEAQQAGIDASEAQQLPGRCGQHVNPIACLASIYASHSFSNSTALCFLALFKLLFCVSGSPDSLPNSASICSFPSLVVILAAAAAAALSITSQIL